MIETKITPEITITIVRCVRCGTFWGFESGKRGTCPYCAAGKIEEAESRAAELERSIRSLRGVITRKKK